MKTRSKPIPSVFLHNGYVRMTTLYQCLMKNLTTQLAGNFSNYGKQQSALKQIMSIVIDPDPEQSLQSFANYPCPFFKPGLMKGPITPLQKWLQLEQNSKFWPSNTQKKAKLLGIGKHQLPTWSQIQKFFKSLGFEAIPVQGYVGAPIYSYLISRKKVPVCTQWVMRYQISPYYVVPPDTFHDLGHGLAMASKDYRDLLVRFSKVALQTKKYLITPELNHYYGWFFEHSYVYTESKEVELIGSAPMAFETIEVKNGKLSPRLKQKDLLPNQKQGHRPFQSRKHWQEQTESFINRLEDQKVTITF